MCVKYRFLAVLEDNRLTIHEYSLFFNIMHNSTPFMHCTAYFYILH